MRFFDDHTRCGIWFLLKTGRLLRQAMKVRSATRRETASPAAREESERRKQAITSARNVLREGLRNAPLL